MSEETIFAAAPLCQSRNARRISTLPAPGSRNCARGWSTCCALMRPRGSWKPGRPCWRGSRSPSKAASASDATGCFREPVTRRMALKIIKAGMDTKEVIARFEAERQALAMMDHPNIARVFDAGATDKGHPFFVMELVKGIPITRFATSSSSPRASG